MFYCYNLDGRFLPTSQYISETDEGIRSARREERLNLFSLDPDTPVSKKKKKDSRFNAVLTVSHTYARHVDFVL